MVLLHSKLFGLQVVLLNLLIKSSFKYVACNKQFFKLIHLGSGKVQYKGAVEISTEKSLSLCSIQCQRNTKCLTLFYNSVTGSCVLHSKNFQYRDPDQIESGWKMYLFEEKERRCPSITTGFYHYRYLDLCYNFNPPHYIDYEGHIIPTCQALGGELLRIDSQDRMTYMEHILVGRPEERVAIQGHSLNPSRTWVLFDGTSLPYTNWRGTPLSGDFYLQMFRGDEWTEQRNYNQDKNNIFLCEIR